MEISFKNLIINFTKKFYENFRTKKKLLQGAIQSPSKQMDI